MKNILSYALITARAGSKGIKHKNLQKINNKSLVEIAINELKKSKKINKIFCSSDSQNILAICKKKKINLIVRPKKFSSDTTTSYEVVLHFLKKLKEKSINLPEIIFLIQPTSPFFKYELIEKILKKYKEKPKANSINSFVELHHKNLSINHTKINKSGEVKYLHYNERRKKTLRQSKQSFFVHGNVFSFKTEAILKYKTLMPIPIYSVLLKKRYLAIDIDDQEDLDLSRILMNNKF